MAETVKRTAPRKAKSRGVVANRLTVMITIVDRRKAEFYADIIHSFDVNMQMLVAGKGTASEQMLSYLGLADSSKTVIFSVIKEDMVDAAFSALEEKFSRVKNGKGISFTIPVSSVIGTLIFQFLSNNKTPIKEKNDEK